MDQINSKLNRAILALDSSKSEEQDDEPNSSERSPKYENNSITVYSESVVINGDVTLPLFTISDMMNKRLNTCKNSEGVEERKLMSSNGLNNISNYDE